MLLHGAANFLNLRCLRLGACFFEGDVCVRLNTFLHVLVVASCIIV